LWPRSLFGRLALLLLAVILVSQAAAIYLFRQDRAALIARQFGDTKLVELRSLRAALAATDPGVTEATLAKFGNAYMLASFPIRNSDASAADRRKAPCWSISSSVSRPSSGRTPSCAFSRVCSCSGSSSSRETAPTGPGSRCRRGPPTMRRRARWSGAW